MENEELSIVKGQIVENEIALFVERLGTLDDITPKSYLGLSRLLKIRRDLKNRANA